MSAITITLPAKLGEQVIRDLAERFARRTHFVRLPPRMWNAPWPRPTRAHRSAWLKLVSAERGELRSALLSLLDELPEIEVLEWRDYGDGRERAPMFNSKLLKASASAYADKIVALVKLTQNGEMLP